MLITQEPTLFLLTKLWRFAGTLRKRILLYSTLLIIANIALLLAPLIFGALITEIEKHGVTAENLPYLMGLLGLIFLKEFVFWLFHGPARVIERLVAFSASLNYRRYLLQGVLDLRLNWHGEHDSGDTIDRVDKAGLALFEFGQEVFQIIQIVIKLLGTSIILLWFSPTIGIGIFLCALLSFFIIFQFDKRLIPQYGSLNEFDNKASAAIFDALSNVTTVKILHIEKSVLEGVMNRFKAPQPLHRANALLNEYKWFTGNMCFQAIAVVPIAFYIYYRFKTGQPIEAGTISTLFLYLTDLFMIFFSFGSFYERLGIFKHRILNAAPIEQAFATHNAFPRPPAPSWTQLAVNNLSFRYDDILSPQLDKVSLTIKRGERIAIIGESGSGKTTFLKVLHGMYPAARGELGFDQAKGWPTCFADIDLKTMLVPQEPEIFSATIQENITLGIEYDDYHVMQAARIAAFDSVIEQLPHGLLSVINEKGINLSGGQKQRLALTRALLFSANKDIILLDESTSSVDPDNEYDIYKNIWQAFAGKTIIASIHKMNLLKFFDRIMIFEHSRIVDQGSFDELFERNAAFKAAWKEFIARG